MSSGLAPEKAKATLSRREAGVVNAPFLSQVAPGLEASILLSATLAVRLVSAGRMSLQDDDIQLVAGLMAVLGFFLAVRKAPSGDRKLPVIGLRRLPYLVLPLCLAGLLQAAVMLACNWPLPRVLEITGIWFGIAAAGLAASLYLSLVVFRHPIVNGWLTRKIAIVGNMPEALDLAEHINRDPENNIQVAGVYLPRAADTDKPGGSIADLIKLSQKGHLSGVILMLSHGSRSDVHDLLSDHQLQQLVADVFATPYKLYKDEVRPPVEVISGTQLIVLKRRPMNEWQRLRKRIFDIVASLLMLALLTPLLILTALAIKLDSRGPVLFLQPRRGLNNQVFLARKFRSMYNSKTDIFADRQTSRGDVRVTRVGRWLRRLSIDEMPQLINVLRGEMSMVGPRPHALHTRIGGKLLSDLSADYLLRYQIKPGITGLAQINGARGELANPEDLTRRLAFDLEYMHRWSLQLDIKIVILTAFKEIVSKYAY